MKSVKWLLPLLLAVTACKDIPLTDYVEEARNLKTAENSATVLKGSIDFKRTYSYTAYRTECDTYICGHDSVERCHTTPPSCRTVRRCPDRPGTQCRDEGICTDGGTTCHTESIPRYCQTNCREVPYTQWATAHTHSPVTLKLKGLEAADAKAVKIKDVELGLNTNAKFKDLVKDHSKAPKELQSALENIKEDHQHVLVLRAKGLKLKAADEFLRLPEGFKKGDALEIELDVEKTDGKDEVTAVGSRATLPRLHVYEN